MWFTSLAARSAWDAVSVNKGESILAYDTFVQVGSKTDFTCLVAVGAFLSAVSSHPLITTDTGSVGFVVGVFNTVLTFVGTWS